MNYHILTLFPEMVLDGLNTSIIGRASGYAGQRVAVHNFASPYKPGGGVFFVDEIDCLLHDLLTMLEHNLHFHVFCILPVICIKWHPVQ